MDSILKLSDALDNNALSKEQTLQLICRSTIEAIPNANLVSLWAFSADRSAITSLINYDATTQSFTQGLTLKRDDHPKYFGAIFEHQLLVAHDAREHPCTRDFTDAYFKPFDIHSLLDFILHKNYAPYGVLCCESKGKAVHWSDKELESIRSIATLISFCFEI